MVLRCVVLDDQQFISITFRAKSCIFFAQRIAPADSAGDVDQFEFRRSGIFGLEINHHIFGLQITVHPFQRRKTTVT